MHKLLAMVGKLGKYISIESGPKATKYPSKGMVNLLKAEDMEAPDLKILWRLFFIIF